MYDVSLFSCFFTFNGYPRKPSTTKRNLFYLTVSFLEFLFYPTSLLFIDHPTYSVSVFILKYYWTKVKFLHFGRYLWQSLLWLTIVQRRNCEPFFLFLWSETLYKTWQVYRLKFEISVNNKQIKVFLYHLFFRFQQCQFNYFVCLSFPNWIYIWNSSCIKYQYMYTRLHSGFYELPLIYQYILFLIFLYTFIFLKILNFNFEETVHIYFINLCYLLI